MEKVFILEEVDKYEHFSDILYVGKTYEDCTGWLKYYLLDNKPLISGYYYKITECSLNGMPTSSSTLYSGALYKLIGESV